jgi:predicted ATPase
VDSVDRVMLVCEHVRRMSHFLVAAARVEQVRPRSVSIIFAKSSPQHLSHRARLILLAVARFLRSAFVLGKHVAIRRTVSHYDSTVFMMSRMRTMKAWAKTRLAQCIISAVCFACAVSWYSHLCAFCVASCPLLVSFSIGLLR